MNSTHYYILDIGTRTITQTKISPIKQHTCAIINKIKLKETLALGTLVFL